MSISKVEPSTKKTIAITASAIAYGAVCSVPKLIDNNISVKDVFQYSNLSNAQKKIVRTSGIMGLIGAGLFGLAIKVNSAYNNKHKV